MLVASFNLSTPQLQVLLAFRHDKDTRGTEGEHPIGLLDPGVVVLRKLSREGYLVWHEADRARKIPPGYSLSAKGEMMLRLVEDELRRTLKWFDGKPLPASNISGAQHDVAKGKATMTAGGSYRRKKPA